MTFSLKRSPVMIALYIIVAIIAFILIIPIFMRKTHHVQRDIVINAPVQQVFDYLKLIRNQEKFNKWAKTDGNRKEAFRGTDGTVGFIYAWSGDKSAGEGEKEIRNIAEGKQIELEYRFVKPFKAIAHFVMTTEPLSEDQTRVTWSNTSSLNYPLNIMVPFVEKSLAKDMDESLNALKDILEK
jgi:hypothetical protein